MLAAVSQPIERMEKQMAQTRRENVANFTMAKASEFK